MSFALAFLLWRSGLMWFVCDFFYNAACPSSASSLPAPARVATPPPLGRRFGSMGVILEAPFAQFLMRIYGVLHIDTCSFIAGFWSISAGFSHYSALCHAAGLSRVALDSFRNTCIGPSCFQILSLDMARALCVTSL